MILWLKLWNDKKRLGSVFISFHNFWLLSCFQFKWTALTWSLLFTLYLRFNTSKILQIVLMVFYEQVI
jgi:hypothetical protein